MDVARPERLKLLERLREVEARRARGALWEAELACAQARAGAIAAARALEHAQGIAQSAAARLDAARAPGQVTRAGLVASCERYLGELGQARALVEDRLRAQLASVDRAEVQREQARRKLAQAVRALERVSAWLRASVRAHDRERARRGGS